MPHVASHSTTSSGPRMSLAERYPLLRPFPMAVFAIGAVLIVFALSVAQTAGANRVVSAKAPAPLVASAPAPAQPPGALVVLSDNG
jgi:hypothetical protein